MQFVHQRREPSTSCFMTRIRTQFAVATTSSPFQQKNDSCNATIGASITNMNTLCNGNCSYLHVPLLSDAALRPSTSCVFTTVPCFMTVPHLVFHKKSKCSMALASRPSLQGSFSTPPWYHGTCTCAIPNPRFAGSRSGRVYLINQHWPTILYSCKTLQAI